MKPVLPFLILSSPLSPRSRSEFKAAVEAAGVLDGDNVDDLSAMVNTDGCNCACRNWANTLSPSAGSRRTTSSARSRSPALSLYARRTSLGGSRYQR
jgi:hypothetical protein